MTVSSVFCLVCQRDRCFFALDKGSGIQCSWCKTIHPNYAEKRYVSAYDTTTKRRAAERRRKGK